MSIQLLEIRHAIRKALKRVGHTNGTKFTGKTNTGQFIHEYMVASDMRTIINKRYDVARKELLSHYEEQIEETEPGDTSELYADNIMVLEASKARPRTTLDKSLLRQYILDNYDTSMDEVDAMFEACSKQAKPAVTLKVEIPE